MIPYRAMAHLWRETWLNSGHLDYDIHGCVDGYLGDRGLLGWDIFEEDNDLRWGRM